MDLKLDVVEIGHVSTLESISTRWDSVVAGLAVPNVFMTADWLRTWWDHFGDGRDLWLLLIEDRERGPVGAAPLMITAHRTAGFNLRVLEFLGTDVPACADHMELACLPGREHSVTDAVAAHLIRASRRWDVATLGAVPEGSATMDRLAHALRANRRRSKRLLSMPCPYLRLDQDPAAYDQHLHRKFRDLKKYLAAVERHNGRFILAQEEAEVSRLVADLRRLNRLRVQGKGAIPSLDRDDFFSFIAQISETFFRRGWLRLYALEVDNEVIAVNLNFAHGHKVYGYMSGLDPAWTRYGVGTVLMRHVIRSAMAEGAREYDFLRGGEDYKYRWTTSHRPATILTIVNHPLRHRVFLGASFAARICRAARTRALQVSGNGLRRAWAARIAS